MPLEEGTRLGQYEILAPLGAGGMGEVYQARDTKLGRDVAVKVLPEHFAEDKERMARFEREARVLASLNHPNIAAVYGLDEAGGTHFLVMELVPGESLAARIRRGPLPVEDVERITRQLIDALEAAHENGVVHRDLKPANVQLTPDGHVKVLDFGLAKVEVGETPSTDLSLSPTMTRDATQAGVILGTASYTSPEQARGLPVDKRSDIFSFGCVVFEMLTGRKAFEGDLVSDVMAAVIKSEPNWSLLPRPAEEFRKLLERCLEKDPKPRLRDIGDARVELAERARPAAEALATNRSRAVALAVGTFFAGALVAGLMAWRWAPGSDARAGVTRFRVDAARGGGFRHALAPDGRTLVLSHGQRGLYVRSFDSWETGTLLEAGSQSAYGAFFSPDGQWVGFLSDDDNLGDKRPISNDGGRNPIWSRDGRRLFYRSPTHVMAVDLDDGESARFSPPEAVLEDEFFDYPGGHGYYDVMPDGRLLVFEGGDADAPTYVNVVVNWAQEVEARVPR